MTKNIFYRLKYKTWRYLTVSFLNLRFPFLRYNKDEWFTNSNWYYQIPTGWRRRFGYKMCREIDKELRRCHWHNNPQVQYEIFDIKEKYGSLRWYDLGSPIDSNIIDIIEKYDDLSSRICIECGRDAKYISAGWISPYCKKHIKGKKIFETL